MSTPDSVRAIADAVMYEGYMSWEEAVEREVCAGGLSIRALDAGLRIPIAIPAGVQQEDLLDERGRPAGALRRSWHALGGDVSIGCHGLEQERNLIRLAVRVSNSTPFHGGAPPQAPARTLFSNHLPAHPRNGALFSLRHPPPGSRAA